jgi:hypothetical protein
MGLVIEMVVSVLLAATLWYCISLNRRLKAFKADEDDFRKLIADLGAATAKAETAVPGLRVATAEAEKSLGEKLRTAELSLSAIDKAMRDGEDVLSRISQIVAANKAAEEAAIAAATQQQIERAAALPPLDRVERLSDAARAARELALKARERKLAEAA